MDHNIPFGYEQTIPADKMVCLLASLVPAGSSVMEIGCGSGKLAKLLAEKCREVVGVEIQELPDGNTLPPNVTLIRADGCTHDTGEKFDCIVVSFAAEMVWPRWVEQLSVGGLLVAPILMGGSCRICLFRKEAIGVMELIDCPAYASFTNEVH